MLKGFLIGAGSVLALAALGVLAINLYVQSAGTQKRIERALSSGLKVPVHVTSTIVTPWSGLKASGVTVPQTPPAPGNFLEVSSFSARFDWIALFKHRLEVTAVSMDQPRVLWFQSPDGHWDLPRIPAPAPAPSAGNTPAPRPAGPQWSVTVHRLDVSDASFDFWDEKGLLALEFAGVQFNCMNPSAAGTLGTASSKYVSLRDKLFFHDLRTNWSFALEALKLTDFQTGIAGGEIRGNAQVATQTKHSPFTADVNFDNVDVDQLMVGAGQPQGQVTGKLKGWLDLSGNSGKRNSIYGTGHLELAGGQMQNLEIFQMLGQALQIPDLVQLNLKAAQTDFRVVGGTVNVDRLVLESQNLELTGTGTIGENAKLNLDARLSVDNRIINRLPGFVVTYFKAVEGENSRYIDFKVNNTLTHPKTNLIENILGRRTNDEFMGLVNSIFGRHHKHPPAPEQTPP